MVAVVVGCSRSPALKLPLWMMDWVKAPYSASHLLAASRRRFCRTRLRSDRSSADTASRVLLLIGLIAGIQSNRHRAKRHLQDNLFWPAAARRYRLDVAGVSPHAWTGQSAGRPLPLWSKGCGRGKSGLHRHTVPDNIRRGRPQGQCHRERTAPPSFGAQVRVKRCGKSAPRVRQRKRHGKPHREQDRIGTATRACSRKRKHRRAMSGSPSG